MLWRVGLMEGWTVRVLMRGGSWLLLGNVLDRSGFLGFKDDRRQ